MFKKLALVMACAISAAMFFTGCSEESSSGSSSSSSGSSSSSSSTKIDQSSKKAVVRTFMKAVLNQDFDTIWAICSPDLQKEMIEDADGDKTKAKQKLADELRIPKEKLEEVKKELSDKEKFEAELEDLIEKNDSKDAFVQIDGKWYINKELD